MKSKNDGCFIWWVGACTLLYFIGFFCDIFSKDGLSGVWLLIRLISIILIIPTIIVFIIKFNNQRNEIENQSTKIQNKEKELLNEKVKYKQLEDINKEKAQTVATLQTLLSTSIPFSKVSRMYADAHSVLFDDTIDWLIHKPHPAHSAAETLKEFRATVNDSLAQYNEMLYKYQFLLSIFPELKEYVEDDEALINLSEASSYQEIRDNYDRVHDYISDEEYRTMTTTQRNQLALDRYKNRTKSAWTIGAEYEMYIDYKLRTSGFETIPFGIEHGLKDLGRDIIAYRLDSHNNIKTTYIIQCKYWSHEKLIHENVVCQIFGSAMEYKIKHPQEYVIPAIYSNIPLSEMANAFAQKLNVEYRQVIKGEYPLIKCNINNGAHIYHLPFDQQYWHTQIKESGEFYAFTVAEAEKAGFRRAMRHNPYINN